MNSKLSNRLCYLLTGTFAFFLHWRDVAPVIGMGPAGMLTAAVATGGIGPVPGYPVHNLISRIFMLLPMARADFAVHIADFSLAIVAIVLAARLCVELASRVSGRAVRPLWILLAGVTLVFLYFSSPGLARISYFGDRYTTELVILLLASSLFICGAAPAFFAFLMVFGFFCHAKSLIVIWLLSALVFWRERHSLSARNISVAIALGFAPLLYLVLISKMNPFFDWNNPETWQNLLASVTRREYRGISLQRSWAEWLQDWERLYRLLLQQYSWAALGLAGWGLAEVFRFRRSFGFAILVMIALTGEGVAFLQRYPTIPEAPVFNELGNWYMLNYYGPYYTLLAILAALGLLVATLRFPEKLQKGAQAALVVTVILLNIFFARENTQGANQLTSELVDNYEASVPVGGILFTNVDSLYAPLVYNQIRHSRMAGRFILHTELMFRSWYYDGIEKLYPGLWQEHAAILIPLRDFFTRFEAGGSDDRSVRIDDYMKGMNALARAHMAKGSYVYADGATHPLRGGLFQGFQWEPEVIALRLLEGSYRINDLAFEKLKFAQLAERSANGDIWAETFRASYVRTLEMRLKRAKILSSAEVPPLEALLHELNSLKRGSAHKAGAG